MPGKKNKNKKAAKVEDDDDFDALMEQFAVPQEEVKEEENKEKADTPAKVEGDDDNAATDGGEKKLSKAQKKRLKDKQKKEALAAAGDDASKSVKPSAKKEAKPKKLNAIQQRILREKKERERLAEIQAEKDRLEEEEERRLQAEEEEREKQAQAQAEIRKQERENAKQLAKQQAEEARQAKARARLEEMKARQAKYHNNNQNGNNQNNQNKKKKKAPQKSRRELEIEKLREKAELMAAIKRREKELEDLDEEEKNWRSLNDYDEMQHYLNNKDKVIEEAVVAPVVAVEAVEEIGGIVEVVEEEAWGEEHEQGDEDEEEDIWGDDEEEELTEEEKVEQFNTTKDDNLKRINERRAVLLAEKSAQEAGSDEDDEEDDDDENDEQQTNNNNDSNDTTTISTTGNTTKTVVSSKKNKHELRSPIVCVLGHVDTGKTKILDKIRATNVQDREAGGITQQIGATYMPLDLLKAKTSKLADTLKSHTELTIPGLLVIDTPGHESFTNLRSRGSNLCDIAILVIDIMHGLEPQTIESIRMLRERKTPFVVALNKIDRLYDWKSIPNNPFKLAYPEQKKTTQDEFKNRMAHVVAELAGQELNACLYSENKDIRKWVSLVPTSAHTGEGIPDLLYLISQLCQQMMSEKIEYHAKLACTVLEVKKVVGLGTTIDVIVVNGKLHEGDTIIVCGLKGPITTSIRALLTMKKVQDSRVKGDYVHNKVVKAAVSVKISAPELDYAIAGSQLLVPPPNATREDIEEMQDLVMEDLQTILSRIDRSGQGVYVQASTLGSLEALLSFLEDMKIPVSGIALGPVQKKDVKFASTMLEKRPEYATILAFDVPVSMDAKNEAITLGVKIMTAEIIYHLFDQFTEYMKAIKAERQEEAKGIAVFPCIVEIIPEYIFARRDPIIVGVKVISGTVRLGTPLCIPEKNYLMVGIVDSIEKDHKEHKTAEKGDEVCLKLLPYPNNPVQVQYERHFDHTNKLYSKITRASLDSLKDNFAEDLTPEYLQLLFKLKKVFKLP